MTPDNSSFSCKAVPSFLYHSRRAQGFIMEEPEVICGYMVSTVLKAPRLSAWSQAKSKGWDLVTKPCISSRVYSTFSDTAHKLSLPTKPELSKSPKMRERDGGETERERGRVSSGVYPVSLRRKLHAILIYIQPRNILRRDSLIRFCNDDSNSSNHRHLQVSTGHSLKSVSECLPQTTLHCPGSAPIDSYTYIIN